MSLLTILSRMLAVFVTLALYMGRASSYVGLGQFVYWFGPICMLGEARVYDGWGQTLCMVCGILVNSLSFVPIFCGLKIFQVVPVQERRARLECITSLDGFSTPIINVLV